MPTSPSVLGEVLLLHQPIAATPDVVAVVLYTLVDGVMFVAFGVLLGAVMRAAATSALGPIRARPAPGGFRGVLLWSVDDRVGGGGGPVSVHRRARGEYGRRWADGDVAVAGAHPRLRAAFRHEPLGAGERADTSLPVEAARR